MEWERISVQKIVLEFLLSERKTRLCQVKPHEFPAFVRTHGLNTILDKANLESPVENHARLRLLCLIRRQLICEIPPDTDWYRVRNLTDNELLEMRIIGRCGLDDWADNNEVLKPRRQFTLTQAPSEWRSVILFGHAKAGPFTIIEGNHRLIAYTSNDRRGLSIPVYVGFQQRHSSLTPWIMLVRS